MDEKLNIYKSSKISKNKYTIRRPKRRLSLNVTRSLNICNHKGRWVVALTDDDWSNRIFRSCDTINRTEALKIISLLVDYINLVKPTEATALTASIRASTNRTLKVASELSAIALNSEIQNEKTN
jgi:hypothetical protein